MSDTPPTTRLVIRIKLPPQGTPPAPVQSRFDPRVALLIAGVVAAALLIWFGFRMFRSEPVSVPVVAQAAVEPVVVPEVQKLDTPTAPVNEVVPTVSQGARDTISGTIRVIARVTLDKEGKVVETALYERGPSRYFARLATESAAKWTFTPTNSEEQRKMFVTFYYKRSGTSARASSAPPSP